METLSNLLSEQRKQASTLEVQLQSPSSLQLCNTVVFVFFCCIFFLLGQTDIFVNGTFPCTCDPATLMLFINSCMELTFLHQLGGMCRLSSSGHCGILCDCQLSAKGQLWIEAAPPQGLAHASKKSPNLNRNMVAKMRSHEPQNQPFSRQGNILAQTRGHAWTLQYQSLLQLIYFSVLR